MSINLLVVLLEGFVSFFSPCIIPILPLYFGYLSGNAKYTKEDGTIVYKQKKIFIYTVSFVIGICTSFFILGLSFSIFGNFFEQYKEIISLISGIIIIIFGLFQLGIFRFSKMEQEYKLKFNLNPNKLNLLATYFLGFTFSFAWTPCVGPTLSSVLLLVASSSSFIGFLYIALYALGFIIPFLIIGIFTTPVLNLIKKNQKNIKNFIKIAGILIILVGINLIVTNSTKLIKSANYDVGSIEQVFKDYQGKVVVLSFIDKSCTGCLKEMPDIEELYQEQKEDIVIIGIMPAKNEQEKKDNEVFLKEKEYHFNVIYDDGSLEKKYYVKAYPTTIIFNKDGVKAQEIIGTFQKKYIENIIDGLKNDICLTKVC